MSKTSFVPWVPFAEYRERFAGHFVMERTDGVLEVRFHTDGHEALWSLELHRALSQLFQAIGQDPENELMIITGTGDSWLTKRDTDSMAQVLKPDYDVWYLDCTKLIENLLWCIDIPTIAAINGPGFHTEFGLLCDLTIAADDTCFFEPHFALGVVPGDGQFLVYQQLLGLKRANHTMYLRTDGLSAGEALDWGLIGETRPREELLPRAREIADKVMQQPRVIRRLTSQVAKRPWRRLVQADFGVHLATELFGGNVSPRPLSNFERSDREAFGEEH